MIHTTSSEPRTKVDGLQYIRLHECIVIDFVRMLLPAESEALAAVDVGAQIGINAIRTSHAIHALSHFGIFDYVGRLDTSLRIYFKADIEKIEILQGLLSKVKGFGFTSTERTMVSIANLAMRLGRDPNGSDPEMVELLERAGMTRKRLMTDSKWFSTHKGLYPYGRTFTFTPTTEMLSVAFVWRSISTVLDQWRMDEDTSHVFLMPERIDERPRLRLVA